MKIFGYEVSPQDRDDAVFVIACALLLNGVGTVVYKAFDTASPIVQWERIEQRLDAIERQLDIGKS